MVARVEGGTSPAVLSRAAGRGVWGRWVVWRSGGEEGSGWRGWLAERA